MKMFGDRQLRVAPDVIDYILARMDRSFESARRLVHDADRKAMAEQRAVTVPLVKGLLGDG